MPVVGVSRDKLFQRLGVEYTRFCAFFEALNSKLELLQDVFTTNFIHTELCSGERDGCSREEV